MNDIFRLSADITKKRGLVLLVTHDRAHNSKTGLIASLILHGSLFVVSGDEWLPSFSLPHIIREHTTEVKMILDRLYSVRASTCHRLYDSLAYLPSKGEPILVMDFLHTFYNDDIPLRTRLFRLRECCRELKRLAFYRPVFVMTQSRQGQEYEKFLPALHAIADKVFTLEPEMEDITQPALF